MDYLMGIDLGSTSLKAIVYDLDGNVVARGSRPTERHHPSKEHPEWTVWLPEQIWGDTAAAIREAVGQMEDPRRIRAAAVTGMGMDGVPMDAEGKWLYPFISWHDPRTAPQLKWWQEHIGAARSFPISGNPVWAMNSALRILWMQENEPEILARAETWLLIEDFLNFMLCGRRATDYSMASCTLLFDQHTLNWSEELLRLSGIDRRLLPEPHPSGTPLGEVTASASAATGLPAGTPVILGGHDHICGTLPVGAFRPGMVLDITGTWECVLAPLSRPVLTEAVRRMGVTIQAHVARGLHTAWGGAPAGEMLEWYRKQFGSEAARKAAEQGGTDWDYLMVEAAESPPGANGVMFLPHLSGAAIPVADERSLGAFVGLRTRTTRSDMIRAILEALDFQFLDMVHAVEGALGTKLEKFVAVGGALRNEFWMQNKADVVGRPIEAPAVEEASPLGAAILAGIGAGLYADAEDGFHRVYRPGKTYQPEPKLAKTYAGAFDIYKQLYPAVSPVSHRLFDVFMT